jgi:hypothetical protein
MLHIIARRQHATTHVCRFRQAKYRLQAGLVETRRVNGKVRHEHVASLGSIEIPQAIPVRLTFWQQLHERLARLANRLTGEARGKVLAAVHARIPMVTPDEQRTLQLENAKAAAAFWEGLHGAQTATVEGHKGLVATTAAAIAQGEKAAAESAGNAKTARERIERIEHGENVDGGLHNKQWTREALEAELIKSGAFTRETLRHSVNMAELHEIIGEAEFDKIVRNLLDEAERTKRATVRRLLNEHRRNSRSAGDID